MTEQKLDFFIPSDTTTGIFYELPDYDADFSAMHKLPRFINDVKADTKEEKEKLKNLLVKTYDTDVLETKPSCQCGALSGGEYLGTETTEPATCSDCGTQVARLTERAVEPSFWIAPTPGVPRLIAPQFLDMLKATFGTRYFCPISWLLNTEYRVRKNARRKNIPGLDAIQAYNFKRGMNNFIENFDEIFQVLLNDRILKPKDRTKAANIQLFVIENRDKLFPKHIPLPTSLAFIKEAVSTGTYIDRTVTVALDAILTIIGIYKVGANYKPESIERRTYMAIERIAGYYVMTWKKNLGSKPGLLRKHCYGGRPNWSFRSVITSIHGVHDYRELHIPWALGVTLFSVHLTSKLLDRGFTALESSELIRKHTLKYHKLLDELMQDILTERVKPDEEPDEICVAPIPNIKGFPCIFQRNPTLVRLAAQKLYITKIKTEVNDFTIGISNLVLAGPNADFDGDEMNGMLMLDDEMDRLSDRLAPHVGALELSKPFEISGVMKFPKPTMSTINYWLTSKDNRAEEVYEAMASQHQLDQQSTISASDFNFH